MSETNDDNNTRPQAKCSDCDGLTENLCNSCNTPVCYSHGFVTIPIASSRDIVKTIENGRLFHSPANRSKVYKKTAVTLASLLEMYDTLTTNQPDPRYKDYDPTATPYKVYESSQWASNEIAIYADEAPKPIKGEQDCRYKKQAITIYDRMLFFDDINLKTNPPDTPQKTQSSFIYCKNCLPQNIPIDSQAE